MHARNVALYGVLHVCARSRWPPFGYTHATDSAVSCTLVLSQAKSIKSKSVGRNPQTKTQAINAKFGQTAAMLVRYMNQACCSVTRWCNRFSLLYSKDAQYPYLFLILSRHLLKCSARRCTHCRCGSTHNNCNNITQPHIGAHDIFTMFSARLHALSNERT